MTAAQLTGVQAQALSTWVDQQKASMKITSEAVPTATPATSTFSPPADAPPTPTVTSEAASPVAEGKSDRESRRACFPDRGQAGCKSGGQSGILTSRRFVLCSFSIRSIAKP